MDQLWRQLQYTNLGMEPFNSTMSHPIGNEDDYDYDYSDRFSSFDSSSASSSTSRHGRDAYEFVAFLLWYLFLVLCCVIPTCCAYRRRRLVEARIAQQQASVNRIERQNLFILSSLRHSQQNTERIREQRGTKIAEKLKDTTMTVEEQSIVDISDEEAVVPRNIVRIVDDQQANNEIEDASSQPSPVAVEFDIDSPDMENTHVLQLPAKKQGDVETGGESSNRTVPGACAICLCPYEKGEDVTWSPRDACQHAFHSECIIPWLAKSDEPKCPCCRQMFCDSVPISQLELDPISIFGPATSLAHLVDDGDDDIVIPHFMRTLEASRLEFLASLELAALDVNGRRSHTIHGQDQGITGGGVAFSLGGSPFDIVSEEPQETRDRNYVTAEAQEDPNNDAAALAEAEMDQPAPAPTGTDNDNNTSSVDQDATSLEDPPSSQQSAALQSAS